MRREKTVIVRKSYHDKTYRTFLHDAFRLEYQRDGRGRQPFYLNVIQPLIDDNIHLIKIDTGDDFQFQFPALHRDFRNISEYIRKDNIKTTPDAFLRMIDAFMQLKVPGFNATFLEHQRSDETGLAMGEFLRDPGAATSRSRLALNAEPIVGIYEYEDIDTFQEYRGAKRIVSFLRGERIDYLLMLDFDFEAALSSTIRWDEHLNLIHGFCVPGEAFSPVVMRSLREHKRHLGLLYAPGNLIEMYGGVFDELTYEIFTTDKEQQGSRQVDHKYADFPEFAEALEIHYGPRLRKHLSKVTDRKEIDQISNRIGKMKLELL